MNTRENLLQGIIETPVQILELLGWENASIIDEMFQNLWYNYLKNKSSISSVYWYDKIGNDRLFNTAIMHLSNAGWIESIVEPKRNWAEIRFREDKLFKWLSKEEILVVRREKKFNKYKLEKEISKTSDKVKVSSGIKSTGLIREGFTKAGNNKFQYDVEMIKKYKEAIELNLTKSIRMLDLDYSLFKDGIDYESVSKDILQYHIDNPNKWFTTGENVSDSRGRAISKVLGKVFNPISFKDARALLVTEPDNLGIKGLEHVYLAISELLGYKPKTLTDKVQMGKEAYQNRKLRDLDLDTEEGRKDLYENIWLERIYNNLDRYDGTNWTVAIEKDATASMLQIEGVLLGHEPFLDMTNVIGEELKDAWSFKGISRLQFKKAMTPLLYASSKTCQQLWRQNKIEYTLDQVRAFNKEINYGVMAVANKFKEFIIRNVVPKEKMTVKIWDETFDIECNRYKAIGDYTKRYNIFSTKENRVISIYHTHTKKIPDLKQFTRYFVTLLIHNLDSQIANNISSKIQWIIPIHDAFLVKPKEASGVCYHYIKNLKRMYEDRERILIEYFKTIGIDSKSAGEWYEVMKLVVPVKEFNPQSSALK